MVFQEGRNGPFWMTPKQHVTMKFSQYDEPSLKYNTKYELLGDIKISMVGMYVVKGKKVGDLQGISR